MKVRLLKKSLADQSLSADFTCKLKQRICRFYRRTSSKSKWISRRTTEEAAQEQQEIFKKIENAISTAAAVKNLAIVVVVKLWLYLKDQSLDIDDVTLR